MGNCALGVVILATTAGSSTTVLLLSKGCPNRHGPSREWGNYKARILNVKVALAGGCGQESDDTDGKGRLELDSRPTYWAKATQMSSLHIGPNSSMGMVIQRKI